MVRASNPLTNYRFRLTKKRQNDINEDRLWHRLHYLAGRKPARLLCPLGNSDHRVVGPRLLLNVKSASNNHLGEYYQFVSFIRHNRSRIAQSLTNTDSVSIMDAFLAVGAISKATRLIVRSSTILLSRIASPSDAHYCLFPDFVVDLQRIQAVLLVLMILFVPTILLFPVLTTSPKWISSLI